MNRSSKALANHASNAHYLLFGGFCCILAYGLFRAEPVPMPFHQADKIAHFSIFAGLGLWGCYLCPGRWRLRFWPALILLAALAEPAQAYWRPLRVFSEFDALANIAGALLALLMVYLWPSVRGHFGRLSGR
ncbi:MAG: hypothetical protein OIF35_01660 [Cellvibrionaceae bacterium]|nr:hypothetical protein [Cellvibrionaceae bacterium]MCV6627750.1 hypothetical protein [Cellvibrionaceae bacterium]